ncbi:MAG: 2Fe-2S iron-sulfur cluster-binding protein [Vicinamibacterales bacterium]
MFLETAAPASLTALHLTIAVLRRHRAAGRSIVSPFVLPSFIFVLVPWLWPTAVGLALGVGAHALWFFTCELLAPAVTGERPPAAPRPKPATTPRLATAGPPASAAAAVLAVLDEAADIKTFRLARPDGFEFSPGQFLAVRVQIDGKPHVRCYSISSAPHACGYLEISVRRQGLVSGMLHATVRAGSTLTINRPAGQFVYPQGDDRPLVLIAGGIGITPLLSMLRHAVAAAPARPITLLYSARREHDVAFHGELRVLAERHPQVRVAITLTQPTEPTRLRTGRLDVAMVRQFVSAPADSIFCLCGPGPMIADLRAALAGLGVPDGQVRYEQFETAVVASQVNAAATRTAPAGTAAPAAVTLTFEQSGVSVSALSSMTLLESAEAEGVAIVSSCRAGVCQSCRTRLKAGDADCRSDVLDPDDRAAGFVLPCVTWPNGDCVLEA